MKTAASIVLKYYSEQLNALGEFLGISVLADISSDKLSTTL